MIKSKNDLYPSTVAYIKRTAKRYSDATNTYDWLVMRVSNEFGVPKSTAREWIYYVTAIPGPDVIIKQQQQTPSGVWKVKKVNRPSTTPQERGLGTSSITGRGGSESWWHRLQ